MKPNDHRLLLAVLAFVFAAGCSSRTVKPQQSYDKLKPIGVAPQTSSTPTLVVQINNVRDHGKSRKNSAALFINDQEITPSNATQDANPRDNIYELSLASGVYKIEAVYHAQSFWKAKDFKITTQDGKVRVYPNHSTTLAITLDKKPDGALQRQKNFFSEIPQALSAGATLTSSPPAADKPSAPLLITTPQNAPQAQPQARASIVEITSPVQQTAQPASPAAAEQAAPVRSGQIALQINTSPTNAEVIVDNKYLGQSPLVTYVDRGQNHVIQISKNGYATTIKVLEHREFGNQNVYFFIEKLEAQR